MSGITIDVRGGRATSNKLRQTAVRMSDAQVRAVSLAVIEVHRKVLSDAHGGKVRTKGLFRVSAPGNQIANRTGKAKQSVRSNVFRIPGAVIGVVGSPDPHVLYNEVGATITAKRGALVIPTVNVTTPTGALRGEWAGVSLRDVWKQRGLFILGKKGKQGGFIARHIGSVYRDARTGRMTRKSEPLFLLRKSVSIAARHMYGAVARKIGPTIAALVKGQVGLVLAR